MLLSAPPPPTLFAHTQNKSKIENENYKNYKIENESKC